MSAPRDFVRTVSGSADGEHRSRRALRGAGLTLLFVAVLTAGAVTESWVSVTESDAAPVSPRSPRAQEGRPAAQDGEGVHDAEELVSRSGDRWAAAYSADEYAGLRRSLDGEYVGVGVSVRRIAAGRIRVDRVQPGGPADRAGIRAGDRLVAVDGTEVGGLPVTEVVTLLRGGLPGEELPPGSRVLLGLERDGRGWQEELERAELDIETVTVSTVGPKVTRIRIDAFTKGSGAEVRRTADRLPPDEGVLLDLRGNSGGLVSEAAEAASAFLDGGLVATYGEDGTERALHAEAGGNTGSPLVVLVDGGTMSAAELLAGALQDRGRAVVVGTRTFGKGTVQVPREQPDGSVAEVTVGHYTTPGGRTVGETGLVPDLEVAAGQNPLAEARTVLSGLGPRS
ncbi:S41 family peptidase [Streptomyces sp. TRM 70361]|uniref:S41 family peptidase n=1 Tax=Streptomyces sp. TRM 70361 TaxID=3116553 RepID=UPI002E7C2283|nr:S41 family peptidase [Streptomyces sp. TRM 70361]MEE1937849.1 S41 family peptidase [Streptomyces sp. TRM 70361]